MKDKNTAGLIALFLGGFGLHRFYLGQPVLAVFYLIFCWTFIPAVIGFIEALFFFIKSRKSFDTKYNNNAYSMNSNTPVSMGAENYLSLSNLYDSGEGSMNGTASSYAILNRPGRKVVPRSSILCYNGEKIGYLSSEYSISVTNVGPQYLVSNNILY